MAEIQTVNDFHKRVLLCFLGLSGDEEDELRHYFPFDSVERVYRVKNDSISELKLLLAQVTKDYPGPWAMMMPA